MATVPARGVPQDGQNRAPGRTGFPQRGQVEGGAESAEAPVTGWPHRAAEAGTGPQGLAAVGTCGRRQGGPTGLAEAGPWTIDCSTLEGRCSWSRIAYRESHIAYRISLIAYRVSRIAYRISRIAHRTPHTTPHTAHRTPHTAHRASLVASGVSGPASAIALPPIPRCRRAGEPATRCDRRPGAGRLRQPVGSLIPLWR
jgi:hypothetical protein